MPVHDWTRVDAWVFHDFQHVWIGELRNALNTGLLPEGYYALSEQHAGKYLNDALKLHEKSAETERGQGGRKTLAIRHVSGHRLVAIVEIVSPANKDRRSHVRVFLDKLADALNHGIHVLLVDLFPPEAHDPEGIHRALWERLGEADEAAPIDEPLTLAAYVADAGVKAFIEHLRLGMPLPDMPLFLDPDRYVSVPLEATYLATWRGTPAHWRSVLTMGSGE